MNNEASSASPKTPLPIRKRIRFSQHEQTQYEVAWNTSSSPLTPKFETSSKKSVSDNQLLYTPVRIIAKRHAKSSLMSITTTSNSRLKKELDSNKGRNGTANEISSEIDDESTHQHVSIEDEGSLVTAQSANSILDDDDCLLNLIPLEKLSQLDAFSVDLSYKPSKGIVFI